MTKGPPSIGGPFLSCMAACSQAPGLVRLLFLLDENSLVITLRALLRLATPFFFITAFFAIPDRHIMLLSFEDNYGLI